MRSDPYELLGVPRDADDKQIKKAFRALARELHPDVNKHDPEAEEKFKEAAEAYEILSDADRRAVYDRYGFEGSTRAGTRPRHTASAPSPTSSTLSSAATRSRPSAAAVAAGCRAATWPWRSRWTWPARPRARRRRSSSTWSRRASAAAATGRSREPRWTCASSAAGRDSSGRSPELHSGSSFAPPCAACGGDGRVPREPCQECAGRGRRAVRKTLEVDIPPGIADEQRIRLTGRGHAGEGGGPPGDLYVLVRVADDERFVREGELITAVDVPATAAALGTTVTVPTLEGEEEIDVPAGTQPGTVVTLRGRGMPTLGRGRRGDQLVVLNVVVPRNLSGRQRDLLEELGGSLTDENLRPAAEESLFAKVRRAFR